MIFAVIQAREPEVKVSDLLLEDHESEYMRGIWCSNLGPRTDVMVKLLAVEAAKLAIS
jgi:hypothetical protein